MDSPVFGGSPTREQLEQAVYGGAAGQKVNDVFVGEGQDVPFSVYENIKGLPLTAEHFGVEYEFIKDNPDRDIDKLGDKINFIEQFVYDEMNDRGMSDTSENYKKVVGEYLGKINIDGDNLSPDKLLRLHKYLKLNKGYRNKIETILERIK
jgi:hypothetical protein